VRETGSETNLAADWSVRSVYCKWNSHAILPTHADRVVNSALDSATGLLPLELLEFADSIGREKTRFKCVARKDSATLPEYISALWTASITTSPTTRYIIPDSFTHVVGSALQMVVLSPQLGIKLW